MPQTDILVIRGWGIFLSKHSERLQIKNNGKVLEEHPFFRLSDLLIEGSGISLSSDLLAELCQRGINLVFADHSGKPYGLVSSPFLNATIKTQREQLCALSDERGAQIARAVVKGKIKNQSNLIKYFAKSRPEPVQKSLWNFVETLESLTDQAGRLPEINLDQLREHLLGIEGKAGNIYWQAVAELFPKPEQFPGRIKRGAQDPINSAFNYGYGMLYSLVWSAVLRAGLFPFAGFLHTDRPGKPSLVLDLTEEFRQPVVDRTIISCIDRGMKIELDNQNLLTEPSRKAISQAVIKRLESEVEFEGKNHRLKSVIQIQARNLASFLRGEKSRYKPYRLRW